MENKDTNTDYQKFVRVGDQKWEIVEVTIKITFFAWDLYSLSTKSPSTKVSHPKSWFVLSPSYKNIMENGSTHRHFLTST